MAEHTPGPWEVVPGLDDKARVFYVRTIDNDLHYIAQIGRFGENAPANARLIAAAPDLLAALETAVASGKSWHGISSARAAIAKAKGEPCPTE